MKSKPNTTLSSEFIVEPSEKQEEKHLCFLPAHEKLLAKEISWEEHLHHFLLHVGTGSSHPFDDRNWMNTEELYDKDPVGYAF